MFDILGLRRSRRASLTLFVSPLLAAVATGCLSGGGGGHGGGASPNYDISGQWSVHEEISSASGVCAGSVGETDDYTLTATQDGGELTVTVSTLPGTTFHGTMSGDKIAWTGGYDDGEGHVTFTGMDVAITSLTSYAGTVNWKWSGDGESCRGVTAVNGSRPDPIEPLNDDKPSTINNKNDDDCREACSVIQDCFADLSMEQCIEGCVEGFDNDSCEACFEMSSCDDFMPCIGDYCGAPVDEWDWQP